MINNHRRTSLWIGWNYSTNRALLERKTTLLIRYFLIIFLLATQFVPSTAYAQSTANSKLPLVYANNLKNIGGFRVPKGWGSVIGTNDPNDTFSFSSGILAFNPADGGIFLGLHAYTDGGIAEVSIPALVYSSKVTDLNTGTLLQKASKDLVPELTYNNPCPLNEPGGLIVANGHFVGTANVYYNAAECGHSSHFYTSSTNLSSMTVTGACILNNSLGGPGFVAGYMCPIPSNWQADLKAPYITGATPTTIVSSGSCGPSAFGFDPSKLSVTTPSSTATYLAYPENEQTLGGYGSNYPTGFNGTTQILGVAFPEGTRSILFFGTMGTGKFCYGDPNANGGSNPEGTTNNDGALNCNDPCTGGKGPHSIGGLYSYFVWAYDALDFEAVANGQKKPWEIFPYSIFPIKFPFGSCGCPGGGVTYDTASGTIYFAEMSADSDGLYNDVPVIQAFKVTGLGSSPSSGTAPTSSGSAKETAKQRAAALKAAEHAAKDKAKQNEAAAKAAEEAAKEKAKREEAAAKAAEEAAKEEDHHH